MEHAHDHHHAPQLTNVNRAFIIGIVLNSAFVIIEFGAGFYWNSLALISDAGHNLSDVASLVLALLAFRLAKIKSNATFTYGYRKTTVLASLINAVILLIAIGSIAWESISRLQHPQVVEGNSIAVVAGIGIVVNSLSAFFFFKDKEHDLNVKGAYLHLAVDALVSLGVVIAGIVIYFTQWYWIDTAISAKYHPANQWRKRRASYSYLGNQYHAKCPDRAFDYLESTRLKCLFGNKI